MKIRKGFVSNSSSSSFLVVFPKRPESIEEVQRLMFGDEETFDSFYGDDTYTTRKIAETVFNDIAIFEDNQKEYEWAKFTEDRVFHKYDNKGVALWRSCKDEDFVCEFEYCDNDGEYFTTLEHGDIFRNLPSVRFNNH